MNTGNNMGNADFDRMPSKRRYPLWVRAAAFHIRMAAAVLAAAYSAGKQTVLKILGILRKIDPEFDLSPGFLFWAGGLFFFLLLGGYAFLASLLTSIEILEFAVEIPWEALIATYVFLVTAGSGLCVINALGPVFGMRRYEILSRRTVFLSLTSIIFGMSCIVLHLGHPERLPIYNALSPNFRSAISWMGALYSIYLAVVAVELWLLLRPELMTRAKTIRPGAGRRLLLLLTLAKFESGPLGKLLHDCKLGRLVGILAFISGISALTMLGSVFAHTESRPLWHGAYYPIYFLVSALFTGCALLLTAMIMSYRFTGHVIPPRVSSMIFEMAQLLAALLVAGLGLTAYRLSAALYLPRMQAPATLLLSGEFSPVFWIFEIGLMTIMPVLTLFWASRKKSLAGVLSGSLAVLTGALVMRYIFVVGGQAYPVLATNPVFQIPTVFEIMLVCGALGAFCMIYTLGERFLPLMDANPHQA